MARKVFISILGTGLYGKCKYTAEDFCSSETKFAQQATLEFINAKEWTEKDKVFIVLTEKAKKLNWDLTERCDSQAENSIKYSGLKQVLANMHLPIEPEEIPIPDGKNEDEMWKIFNSIFEKLEEKDKLYIDLTHSYRYLPMLMLVLSNYAKFLKDVEIIHLSYGNYEARNENNEAPIVNLLPISFLQDWTFAAADYLENGNTYNLSELSKLNLTSILRNPNQDVKKKAFPIRDLMDSITNTTEDLQTCRGMNIVNSTNIKKLKENLSEIESTFIQPLNPVIDKIRHSFDKFDNKPNIKNGFAAAQWCFDNGLYQQSATILQENVVTFFCEKHKIEINDEERREIVNAAFYIKSNKKEDDENSWKVPNTDNYEENKSTIKSILNDKYFLKEGLVGAFSNLTEIRNDINHSGMRSKNGPLTAKKLKNRIKDNLVFFTTALDINTTHNPQKKYKKLLNLTNHPSALWDETQLQAAKTFGEIVDMPFPPIDPEGDEEYIDQLSDEYLKKIMEIAESEKTQITVHLMGEMTFTVSLVGKLKNAGIACISSTSRRNSIDHGNGQKEILFKFIRFRTYQ